MAMGVYANSSGAKSVALGYKSVSRAEQLHLHWVIKLLRAATTALLLVMAQSDERQLEVALGSGSVAGEGNSVAGGGTAPLNGR